MNVAKARFSSVTNQLTVQTEDGSEIVRSFKSKVLFKAEEAEKKIMLKQYLHGHLGYEKVTLSII